MDTYKPYINEFYNNSANSDLFRNDNYIFKCKVKDPSEVAEFKKSRSYANEFRITENYLK